MTLIDRVAADALVRGNDTIKLSFELTACVTSVGANVRSLLLDTASGLSMLAGGVGGVVHGRSQRTKLLTESGTHPFWS